MSSKFLKKKYICLRVIKLDKNFDIFNYFPDRIKSVLFNINENELMYLNEINIVNGQPLFIKLRGKSYYVGRYGVTHDSHNSFVTEKTDICKIFELITQSSPYSYKRFINEGFLTLDKGHRVGIIGNYITESDQVLNVNNINALCFRVNQGVQANIDIIFDDIYCNGIIKNTIVIAPPGCGKTTFLRSFAKALCNYEKLKKIIKCTIIDERYEISACKNGIASLDVGITTSTISGLKKHTAIPIAVRSMAPDVIITDELATLDDINAIKYARASGCSVIASVHGYDEFNNELKFYDSDDVFEVKIVLSTNNGPGTIEKVINGDKL